MLGLAPLSRLGGDGSVPVTMDMGRDSGEIEEVADFIIGVSRKDIAGPELLGEEKYQEEKDIVYARLLKNKRGSGKRIKIHQNPETGKMTEMQLGPGNGPADFKDPDGWRENE